LRIASDADYGPHIYAADPIRKFVVMEHVTPSPETWKDRASDRRYKALGEVLRRMHYFDLATVIIFNCFRPQHENVLLSSYFERPMTKEEKAKLYLMKQVVFMCFASRLFSKHYQTFEKGIELETFRSFLRKILTGQVDIENPEVQFRFGLIMFIEATSNFHSSEFQESVEILLRPHASLS
jgi:hypothetical protein